MIKNKFEVIVISLKRTEERRKACVGRLQEIGIDPIIFDAIDGNEIDLSVIENTNKEFGHQVIKLPYGRKVNIDHKFSVGEYGCALSHLQVYEKIIKDNLDFALILEDDVILNKNIFKIIDFLKTWKQEWDVFQLSNNSGLRPKNNLVVSLSETEQIYRAGFKYRILNSWFNRRRFFIGAYAYFITKEACSSLLKIGYPVKFNSDLLLGSVAINGLNTYYLKPLTYCLQSYDSFESSLESTRANLTLY